MLFIEIHIKDELLHRWSMEDFGMGGMAETILIDDFETRALAVEGIIQSFLEIFFLRIDPMLKSIMHYTIYLIRESKMNFEPINEMSHNEH